MDSSLLSLLSQPSPAALSAAFLASRWGLVVSGVWLHIITPMQTATLIAGYGPLKPDTMPVSKIAENKKAAANLVDKVGFDN